MTKRYGVIGYPVKHSQSPEIHNRWFRHFKIDASYELLVVPPDNLSKFMIGFKETHVGASVTIPHKEAVGRYLDVIDPVAAVVRAVNTLYCDEKTGKWHGTNTDWLGALQALSFGMGLTMDLAARDFSFLRGKQVLLLGAGGAARAMAYAARFAAAELVVLNRTKAKAEALAKGLGGGRAGGLSEFANFRPDIVINATSVGLANPHATPLPPEAWSHFMRDRSTPVYVMDMVFNPLHTKMLKEAGAAGCQTITGDLMLSLQAREAFCIWTGLNPPEELVLPKNQPHDA